MRQSPLPHLAAATLLALTPAAADWIWIEGEKPASQSMNRHPWWYDQVKRDQFSGGDFISNFDKDKPGAAEYRFTAPSAGDYDFWVRANPVKSALACSLNGGAETAIDLNATVRDNTNVAADGKPDLRFIAWSRVGTVPLKKGENTIRFRMEGGNENHGYLDCFVFSSEPFLPNGLTKPDQLAAETAKLAAENKDWFAFVPKPDPFSPGSATDLRFLNEAFAGENGHITIRDGAFTHSKTGEPVRFWAVNGPPDTLKGPELKKCARMLAKYGVNMVRVHHGYFDKNGDVDPAKVLQAIEVVEAMKAEGIYTHFSIFFPLWFDPQPGNPWLPGYNGSQHSFATLMFNPAFQRKYREWWTALLTTPSPATGKTLASEAAVSSLEIQNEDSFFFWTFDAKNIPDPQLKILETQFATWLAAKHGSLEKAFAAWGNTKLERDNPAEGRAAFRPLWNITSDRSPRDKDTAAFLLETQTRFYQETRDFLRSLGFKGAVTASNWHTADPQILGPLENLSYTAGDFIDRHGYFSCNHKGDNAAWSIRDGHTYSDRSALRFDPQQPGKPRDFNHPVMDICYDGKPSMISETTWCRPNRFRGEAPAYYAAYGALQGSDAIVHFALDSSHWTVKPGFFMQPWTLMAPTQIAQFPATALIFRKALVTTGDLAARVNLSKPELLDLKGTPLPQNASLDELRLADVPKGGQIEPGKRLTPLLHYVGRSEVRFTDQPTSAKVADLGTHIDTAKHTIRSNTDELLLDYGRGVLALFAPKAQGVSGMIGSRKPPFETPDLTIESDMQPGHILAVSLDGQALATSKRMLLQVMSEEKATGFQTEAAGPGTKRILNIGTDPWLVRKFSGTVKFKRPDAASLTVTPLDPNGYPLAPTGKADNIPLAPETLYYLITSP